MTDFVQNLEKLKWQVGLETDIGGGKENQDECFVWIKKDDNLVVLCVLDGHGREVGRIAAESAKSCLFKHLDNNYQKLIDSPTEFLIDCHELAHNNIKQSFKMELESLGFEVKMSEEGYLLKRKPPQEQWACIHGGTSCSMVALVGQHLYIANVGDSSGILCAPYPVLHQQSSIQYITDAALSSSSGTGLSRSASVQNGSALHHVAQSSESAAAAMGYNGTLVITAEHSPESPYEYKRLREFRSRSGDSALPALMVVYDSNSHDKIRCNAVFEEDAEGHLHLTNKGR